MSFVILFSDAMSLFECLVVVYADDLKFANPINCINDCLTPPQDLNKFVSRCQAQTN